MYRYIRYVYIYIYIYIYCIDRQMRGVEQAKLCWLLVRYKGGSYNTGYRTGRHPYMRYDVQYGMEWGAG
jgi:hypothetical protein